MQTLADIAGRSYKEWSKVVPRRCFGERDLFLTALCKGRSVLHIGAADAPFHVEKARQGSLLHQKVAPVTTDIVGIDINKEAVAELKECGVNLLAGDALDIDALDGRTFDVVLCCDVIEHVDNPAALLATCRHFMGDESLLVVTTINAGSLRNVGRALLGREAVHPDHVAYFSFSTLARMLETNAFTPVSFGVFNYPASSALVGALVDAIANFAGGTSDGIIMTAKKTRL